MSERYQAIPRTLCLVTHDGKILLIEYGERKGAMRGYYNALGGHIEAGEGVIESAKREIREESGLEAGNTRLCGVVHVSNFFGKNVMMFVTRSEVSSTETTESEEGRLHWVPIEKLNCFNLFGDVKAIVEKALRDNSVFTAKDEFDGEGILIRMEFE